MPEIPIEGMFALRNAIWRTRDACTTHYPHRCPTDCPSAGQHNNELSARGLCECRGCQERLQAGRRPAQ